MKYAQSQLAFALIVLAATSFVSCKLDVNALRQDTLTKISGPERIFFLENVANSTIDTDLSAMAREAARFGYVQVIRYLLNRGADLNQTDTEGWSPILIAASRGDLALIRFLVEIAGSDVRAKNNSKTTSLMLAASSGSLEVCRYLLDRGANVDAKSSRGLTALMHGVSSGKLELAKLLVERGADTQVIDSFGTNALAYATTTTMKDYLVSLGLK